ncbi:MAG: hypothetical protein JOZ69_23595 [Myxococcales bacterium]|nr:hypothetical protein [Myxococcales bacterium]
MWPWVTLALLGVYHGVNPAMGWLFAVSRGLQEQRGTAVAGALVPIAIGHALAIGLAVSAFALGELALGSAAVRWAAAGVLVSFGLWKFVRHRHPRWVGMRIGFGGLLLWSFLMATAHGAGLMLLPLFAIAPCAAGASAAMPACHARAGLAFSGPTAYVAATLLHTGAMLAAAGVVALVVFHKVGLAILRRAWLNVDRIWAAALVVSGLAAILG